MLIALIILALVIVFIKSGLLGFAGIAIVWIFAGIFNPDLTTGTVWFIAFVVGWMLVLDVD